MKPLILPTPPVSKDGKIHITPDELQKLIDKAYEAGLSDGMKIVPTPSPNPYPYPSPLSPCSPYITWTCGSSINSKDIKDIFTNTTSSPDVDWTTEVKKVM